MSWVRLRFRSGRDSVDGIQDALQASGAIAVTMENAGEDECYDTCYPQVPDWHEVFVTGLFEDGVEVPAVAHAVRAQAGDRSLPLDVELLPDQDWSRTWSRDHRPIRVTERLWICPNWVPAPDADATTVFMEPGLAFGTGTHPTTQLCLEWLAGSGVEGKRIVDYGCGSGILAITALKLGAAAAWGVDIDPHALAASSENARRNGVAEHFSVGTTNSVPREPVDIVIANILMTVIIALSGTLTALVRPGGFILLTGILDSQVDRVLEVFGPRFRFERRHCEDWCLLIGHKTAP